MNKSKLDICIGVVVCSVCFVKAVSYGGSKHASPTNSTPPVMMASRPRLATPTNHQSPTTNYQLLTNWTARGAYCDWQPITFPDTFAFPVGTNLITSLTLFAYGETRSNLHCSTSTIPCRPKSQLSPACRASPTA